MKLHAIELANFRGFEQLEMDFEPDLTVIAGVNGVGKSGILQALAALFARALPEFTLCKAKPPVFVDEDIYYGKPSLNASIRFSIDKQHCYGGIQRIREDTDFGDIWRSFWMSEKDAEAQTKTFAGMIADRTLTGDIDAGRSEIKKTLGAFKQKQSQPVVIYFSPKRHLPGRPKTLPKLRAFEIENAYSFAMQDREVELREFMHWFRVVETGVSEAHRHGKAVLEKLRDVVNFFVPEFHNLHIEESPSLRFVVEKNGTSLSLNQLSDGERGLLAMIFDITRRLSIANPGLSDPIADGSGIILIDEIDIHLHPKWQRQVIRRLTKTFKNCQFIITTHSPQVIGQVRPACLRLLDWNDKKNRIDIYPVTQSFGMDSNWVLLNIMGSDSRDYETEQKLAEIYDQIDDEEFQRSAELIVDLENDVGLFPELQEVKSLLARLEMLRTDETD